MTLVIIRKKLIWYQNLYIGGGKNSQRYFSMEAIQCALFLFAC